MTIKPPPNSIHPVSRTDWRKWLSENYARTEGIWLISYKKGTGNPRFEYDEAVEEALCFGWIDSKPAKLDEERSMLWFAPRKVGTNWSKLNKERVEKLIKAKLMSPSGLAKVEAAKKDGTWNALDAVEALEIPPDLAKALSKNKTAREYFEAFPRSVKRGILEWILNAKKAETRAARIEETVTKAEKNIRANQWRQ
ncbi:MAG: YdeI/OmpD-associated family protein [Anaerolineales bacterium]